MEEFTMNFTFAIRKLYGQFYIEIMHGNVIVDTTDHFWKEEMAENQAMNRLAEYIYEGVRPNIRKERYCA